MNKMKNIAALLISAITLSLSSGCGTVSTRYQSFSDKCTFFGGRPYEAVVQDAAICDCASDWTIVLGAIVAMPFDTALDTILLPPDLVAWACGHHKNPALIMYY